MKKPYLKVITIVLFLLIMGSIVPKETYAAVPSAPTGLTAVLINSDQINLSWNSSYIADYYYVYRSTSYYGTYTLIGIVTSNSHQDTDLDNNTAYYYKIQSVNSSGSSNYSNIASATTSYSSSDITATSIENNQIRLTWNAVSSVTYYVISRSTSYHGTYINISATTSNTYTDTDLSSGITYYYKVEGKTSSGTTIYNSSVASAASHTGSYNYPPISSDRLYGSDRYETAKAISQSGWKSSYYAIVVSGENYPDALCSTPLAAKYNAPILLTTKGNLDTRTKNELVRLNVRSVYLIGGVGVVTADTEQAIKNLGISVTRIAGIDRYDTSLKIAQAIGSTAGEAVIATGENYADALSIASIAAIKRIPILLTPGNSLSGSLKQYLRYNINKTYVVGGSSVISTSVLTQLPFPERLSGSNRYGTNIEVIKRFLNELNLGRVCLATGQSFPDALAGSILASQSNSPVILVSSPLNQLTSEFIQEKRAFINEIKAFGGTNAISNILLNDIIDSNVSAVLSAPSGLSASALSSSQIYLSWLPVSSVDYYYIYRATSYSGTYSLVTSTSLPRYTDSGLAVDTTYYYKVIAVNNSSQSAYSPIVSASTSYAYPAAPTGLTATSQDSNNICLYWNSVPDADYYNIYKATSPDTYSYLSSVSHTSYSDTGLIPNTLYYYKILAYNSHGSSPYSSIVSVYTSPAAPTGFSATAGGTTSINLSWTPAAGANSYEIYSASSIEGPYINLATVFAPNTNYAHTSLVQGTTYYYKIFAKNGAGSAGNFSAVVSATTDGGVPAVPEGLTATSADGLADGSFEVNLSWTAVPTATSYSISRSTAADGVYTVIEAAAATNNYTDSDAALTANTTYYYKAKANNAAGSSAECDAVSVLTAPAIPGNLAANADSQTQITITWDAVAGADSYEVYWDGEDTPRATVPGPICVDSLLTADTTYNYKIKVVNSAGTRSAFSAVVSATTDP